MTVTLNRYATNDSDLREININVDSINTKNDNIIANTDNTATNTDSINVKMGEEVTNPNINTVLGRLKTINTNLTNLAPVNFKVSLEITRPANTSNYVDGDIVNNNASTTLPEFDFSSYGSVANKQILIKTITVISNRAAGTAKLDPFMYFFNSNTITGQDLTDNISFNPSYAELIAKIDIIEPNTFTAMNDGDNSYMLIKTGLSDIGYLNASSKLYLAMVASAGYTPISAEKFYITIKGTIL
jgi:hypothetical protein